MKNKVVISNGPGMTNRARAGGPATLPALQLDSLLHRVGADGGRGEKH